MKYRNVISQIIQSHKFSSINKIHYIKQNKQVRDTKYWNIRNYLRSMRKANQIKGIQLQSWIVETKTSFKCILTQCDARVNWTGRKANFSNIILNNSPERQTISQLQLCILPSDTVTVAAYLHTNEIANAPANAREDEGSGLSRAYELSAAYRRELSPNEGFRRQWRVVIGNFT